PSYVSPAYHLLEGFPFIQEPPSGDLQERVLIRHHDYDQCFQSVQLLQWNSQVKFNVSFNQILKQNAKREMRLRLGKVTVADVLAAQPVTTNLLKFMRASIKMIGVSNLQSFIASMTQKLTLSDISDESKNYLDKAGITT